MKGGLGLIVIIMIAILLAAYVGQKLKLKGA